MERFPIRFSPDVKSLIESFSACFNVRITFFSRDMEEYLVGYHVPDSDFCSMIQKSLGLRPLCQKEDRSACMKALAKGESIVYTCHAGLSEAVIPVRIQGDTAFYALIGQFRRCDSCSGALAKAIEGQGLDRKAYDNAFQERPFLSDCRIRSMLSLFENILHILISTGQMRRGTATAAEEILGYIDGHIGESITIGDAAKALSRSVSSVSHIARSAFGLSFKEMVIERKLRAFDEMMELTPGMTVKEAASLVGYDDPLYFSRLYRKKRRFPPSSMKRKQ